MNHNPAIRVLLIVVAVCMYAEKPSIAHAKETVLYTFQGLSDGQVPTSGVIADAAGNLYGETGHLVYEVSPPAEQGGPWTETVLYTFQGGSDSYDASGGLVFDQAGNLYGTALGGGVYEHGTVFELSPPAVSGGTWTETILYSFQGGTSDGAAPVGTPLFDQAGDLYGTTREGGGARCQYGCGTVFQLTPPSAPGEPWTENVLHVFHGDADGANPYAGVIADPAGNLYGTTAFGGESSSCDLSAGCGAVFTMKRPPSPGGAWAERVLYRFKDNGVDGINPEGGLTIHNDSLYGTGSIIDTPNILLGSTVFEVSLTSGVPTETVLFTSSDFCDLSEAGVVFDKVGNLYGTASGQCSGDWGYIFQLAPPSMPGGTWTEITLYFNDGPGGGDPAGTLLFTQGTLYGATAYGGSLNCDETVGCGIVFSISP